VAQVGWGGWGGWAGHLGGLENWENSTQGDGNDMILDDFGVHCKVG